MWRLEWGNRQWRHRALLIWCQDRGWGELHTPLCSVFSINVARPLWEHCFPATWSACTLQQSDKITFRYLISWFLDRKRRFHCLLTSRTEHQSSLLLYVTVCDRQELSHFSLYFNGAEQNDNIRHLYYYHEYTPKCMIKWSRLRTWNRWRIWRRHRAFIAVQKSFIISLL